MLQFAQIELDAYKDKPRYIVECDKCKQSTVLMPASENYQAKGGHCFHCGSDRVSIEPANVTNDALLLGLASLK